MCSDGIGGAYAIWMDTDGKTYATHLTPDSSQIPNPGVGTVVMDHDWTYASISLETAGGGDAMMVWFDERIVGGQPVEDIYSQRIGYENGSIVTRWSEPTEGGIPICTADGKQEGAKVTYYNEDWNVVVWEDNRQSENDFLQANGVSQSATIDIYAQFIDSDGNKATAYYENGNPLVSNLCYDPSTECPAAAPPFEWSDQTNPRVKASDGGAFVIWIDKRNNNDDIYMEIITPENPDGIFDANMGFHFDGTPVTEAPSTQGSARLTADGLGGAYIVWDDLQNADYNLYIQHYNSNGDELFQSGGISLSDADNNQLSPLVRPDQNGGALAVWEDRKDGSISIYAQHIDSNSGPTLQDDGISMYYGIDGNAFLYNDEDSYRAKSKSLYLNNNNLVYWEDRRGGNTYIQDTPFATYYTYGTFVDNFGPSPGKQLSTYFDQKFSDIKQIDDNFLLSFVGLNYSDASDKIFYQTLDEDLDSLSTSILVDSEENTSQGSNRSYASVKSDNIDFIYSKNGYPTYLNEIFTATVDNSGLMSQFPDTLYSLAEDLSDLTVKDAYSSLSNSSIVIFEEQSVSGNVLLKSYSEEFGLVALSGVEGNNQSFKDAINTDDGVFVIWEENKNGNTDIFGQYISFSGEILGPETGVAICDDLSEQKNPSLDYSNSLNEVMVCWDDRRNSDRDIYCASVQLDSFNVYEIAVTANKIEAQVSPYVKSTLTGSYLVVWEESTLYDYGDVFTGDPVYYYDIFMQEIRSNQLVYNQDVVVCDAFHDQRNPRIDYLTTSSGGISYLIYWEDMRSSGKEDLTNIFSQQLRINDCNGSLGGDVGFSAGACDCAGNIGYDCTGVCGGSALEDECGVCNGLGVVEPYCDCNGNVYDCDEVCGGDNVVEDPYCSCDEDILDCAGECLDPNDPDFAIEDECGECGGIGALNYCYDIDGDGIGNSNISNSYCPSEAPNNWGLDCSSLENPESILPIEYALYQNHPNPFNPITNIAFDVPKSGYVNIIVYNMNGQLIRTLESSVFSPGRYNILWNGLDDYGQEVPSGIYFYSMQSESFSKRNKMIMIK